ncbi:MAG: twin-arginine translocase subunit TatB [Desulfatitalea sp.]|nr:twin-arginine translocase subunit TatB [Desulfatitalea sp.]
MFGIGMPELLVILAVALIVIGPKKLPDLAKSLGRAMGEFKRATNDLKHSFDSESGFNEVRQDLSEAARDLRHSVENAGDSPTTTEKQGQTLMDQAPKPAAGDASEANEAGKVAADVATESDNSKSGDKPDNP